MKTKKIFAYNKSWIREKLEADPKYFEEMAKGQDPDILYIGCSDSRVPAEEIFGLKPGDIFVHRNIANMAPNADIGVLSVINYAVEFLHVKHIVVCGHYGCGGIKAAMEPHDWGMMNPWISNIRDIYRMYFEELSNIKNEKDRYDRLVELNTLEQCVNILKISIVQKYCKEKKLNIHAWVFDLETGKLTDLEFDTEKKKKEITQIYRLKPLLLDKKND